MYMAIKIKGAKKIEWMLKGLEPKLGRKVVRKALRSGAKVIQKRAIGNAASMVGGEKGGDIAESIVVRAMKRKRHRYGVMAVIDPKASPLFRSGKYYIPAAIEFGHAHPGRGGGNKPPKDVPAIPFFRKAFDSDKHKAGTVVKNELKKGIETLGKR